MNKSYTHLRSLNEDALINIFNQINSGNYEYDQLITELNKDKRGIRSLKISYSFWTIFYSVAGLIYTKNWRSISRIPFIMFFIIPNSLYYRMKIRLANLRMHETVMNYSLDHCNVKVDDYLLTEFYDNYLYFCYYNRIK